MVRSATTAFFSNRFALGSFARLGYLRLLCLKTSRFSFLGSRQGAENERESRSVPKRDRTVRACRPSGRRRTTKNLERYFFFRCREDDSGGFFFLSLLSELVGWIPTVNDVSGGIAANYGWIHGLSMQELEIINAAYRDKNPNGMRTASSARDYNVWFLFFLVGFFVRDPSSLIGLPTDARSQFVDQTSEAKVRRDVLLTKLKSKFPVLHDSVNCSKGTPADVSPPPRIKSSNTSAGY